MQVNGYFLFSGRQQAGFFPVFISSQRAAKLSLDDSGHINLFYNARSIKYQINNDSAHFIIDLITGQMDKQIKYLYTSEIESQRHYAKIQ